MSQAPGTPDVAARSVSLLAGPRGRRLLLSYALLLDEITQGAEFDGSSEVGPLRRAVYAVSYDLDPHKGTLIGRVQSERPVITVRQIADLLRTCRLSDPTPELLLRALTAAVDFARYWQEPDGTDVLAARPEILEELRRFAVAVASSTHAAWWFSPVAEASQWAVQWEDGPFIAPLDETREPLAEAKRQRAEQEARALRDRPADATARFSGEWWSRPPRGVPRSTRALADGSPVTLWCVEDAFDWSSAAARRLGVPGGLRIFEIDSAAAWTELCERFPISVTGEVRHDWFRTTGRDGAWAIPDWADVAEHYDAVHLQVGAYLSAAGTTIDVPSSAAASVIAGWDADETFWFTHRVRHLDEDVVWFADDSDNIRRWRVAEE